MKNECQTHGLESPVGDSRQKARLQSAAAENKKPQPTIMKNG